MISASSKYTSQQSDVVEKESKQDYKTDESEENKMADLAILEGFEVVELEQSKGDSVLTLTASNLKFNKATAVEQGYPAHVLMYVNAATKQVAIRPCKENTKNSVPFSKDEKRQTYAVVLKVPALLTAVRKLVDADEVGASISFNGELHPNDKVIIYDLNEGKPTKSRRRKKKDAEEKKDGEGTETKEAPKTEK